LPQRHQDTTIFDYYCSTSESIKLQHSKHIKPSLHFRGHTTEHMVTRTHLKNKIRVQGKARNAEKAEHTRSI
ncbi:MAG: hypothetical protein V3T59_02980, partial [Desulfobacterales bacterium]